MIEVSESRKKIINMIAEYDKRDALLSRLRVFLDPITERGITMREQYNSDSVEIGDFEVTESEMGHIKQYLNVLSGKEDTPVMFLGMDIVLR